MFQTFFFVCQLIKSTLTAIIQLKTLNCVKFDLVVDIVRESIKEDEEQAWASICQKNRQIWFLYLFSLVQFCLLWFGHEPSWTRNLGWRVSKQISVQALCLNDQAYNCLIHFYKRDCYDVMHDTTQLATEISCKENPCSLKIALSILK